MSETEVLAGIRKVLGKLSEEKHKKRFGKWNKHIGFTFKELGKTWTTVLTQGAMWRQKKLIDQLNMIFMSLLLPPLGLGFLIKR